MPVYKNQAIIKLKNGEPDSLVTYDKFKEMYSKIKDERFRHIFAILYFTGCRPKELRYITSAHIRRHKKGKKDLLLIQIRTVKKGKKDGKEVVSYRTVPLSMKYPEIKALWKFVNSVPYGFYIAPLRLVKDERHWISYRLNKYGIDLPPYFFRHNQASIQAMAGVPTSKIAALRGTSEAITEKHYRHFIFSDLTDTAEVW